jgi:four helix bundle protein
MEVPRVLRFLSRMNTSPRQYGPERLRVYDLADRWAADLEERLAALECRRSLAEQLLRAADSVVLNIAEGAAHYAAGQKVNHYRIALASAGEAKAAIRRVQAMNPTVNLHPFRRRADMISGMLAALIRTYEARD